LHAVESQMQGYYAIERRGVALLLLQGDSEVQAQVQVQEGDQAQAVLQAAAQARSVSASPACAGAISPDAQRLLQPVFRSPNAAIPAWPRT
jgi:hypothetical protein